MDYEPILVGAGCLALGYMFGRHCKAAMEYNQASDAPTTSDAACCAQISDRVSVDSKVRPGDEKPEKYAAKRDLAQLDVFDPHFFHKMLRKKDDMVSAYKKQKSGLQPREVVCTKADDSDEEVLAQRLEFFMKNEEVATRASINNPVMKKTPQTVRSPSGLGALATPLQDEDESSPDDSTCRSPKTVVCPECYDDLPEKPLEEDPAVVQPPPEEAAMEVDVTDDAVVVPLSRLLPTSPPPELLQAHDVRDQEQEEVPLPHLVEAKLFSSGKVVQSQEDEAHFVSLVEEALEATEQGRHAGSGRRGTCG